MTKSDRRMKALERYVTYSEEETRNLGVELAKRLSPGAVVALSGDLGCGKTAFTKGVTSYFGDVEDVTSPTFTLVNEYDGSVVIYHFDVYRLENPSLEECDWMDDYLFGDGICLIEWADNIKNVLPENTIWVRFAKSPDDENCREIIWDFDLLGE